MTDTDTKPCPFCAETIKAAAIKCKHCGARLNKPSLTPRVTVGMSISALCGLVIAWATQLDGVVDGFRPTFWELSEGEPHAYITLASGALVTLSALLSLAVRRSLGALVVLGAGGAIITAYNMAAPITTTADHVQVELPLGLSFTLIYLASVAAIVAALGTVRVGKITPG